MAPFVVRLGAAAAFASGMVAVATTSSPLQSYQLAESYDTSNFFDKFTYFSGQDKNRGFVQYQDKTSAVRQNLTYTGSQDVTIRPLASGNDQNGRASVRLESISTYTSGLFIADFSHLPQTACGAWPAFWMLGGPDKWPQDGELDIYETFNKPVDNKITAHTGAPAEANDACKLRQSDFIGSMDGNNCYTPVDNTGCGAHETNQLIGSSTGGVYAIQWTSDYIKVWSWAPEFVPQNIRDGSPDPTKWDPAQFAVGSKCNVAEAFKNMQIILNINFCGDAGDATWNQGCATEQYPQCYTYVQANPDAFKDTYFGVRSIKVYQLEDVQTTTTTSATATTTSAATTSAATTSAATTSADSTSAATTSAATTSAATTSSSTDTTTDTETDCPDDVSTTATSAATTDATTTASTTASETATETESDCPDDVSTTTSATATATGTVTATETESDCTDDVTSTTSATETASPSATVTTTENGSQTASTTASATATGTASQSMTTSTVFTTTTYTITSCAATVTDCPGKIGQVTTETIAVSTTVCPVTETEVPTSSAPAAPTTSLPAGFTTSTVYSTTTYTITSCAATVTNCPARIGQVTTEIIPVSVTVCPIAEASSSAVPAGGNSGPAGSGNSAPAGGNSGFTTVVSPGGGSGSGPSTPAQSTAVVAPIGGSSSRPSSLVAPVPVPTVIVPSNNATVSLSQPSASVAPVPVSSSPVQSAPVPSNSPVTAGAGKMVASGATVVLGAVAAMLL